MDSEEVICSGCNVAVHWSEAECNSEAADADWLCSDCQGAAELKRFREREKLVETLLAKCDAICNDDVDARKAVVALLYARDDVRSFKVTP